MKQEPTHNTKVSEALKRLGYRPGERVVLKRNKAAIIPIEDLELLEELEDQIDVIASKKALAEGKGIPLEQLKKELGL